jgi:AraC-like DNA-binding protein
MRRRSLPDDFSQNNKLPIRIVSTDFGHLAPESVHKYRASYPLPYYFLVFIVEGSAVYTVDKVNVTLGQRELLFSMPHQMQEAKPMADRAVYYKLGFDEDCLSKLPKQYAFLLNPLNQQKIAFQALAAIRLQSVFDILLELLRTSETDPELILAHLHSLLTEINAAYFAAGPRPASARLQTFIGFKLFVEEHFTEHPVISDIAEQLAVSTDSLYQIVRHFSGLSPKAFITNRLMLEARRRINTGMELSVKELAFELGFNDPDYFSRVFKKAVGKTVATFFRDLS